MFDPAVPHNLLDPAVPPNLLAHCVICQTTIDCPEPSVHLQLGPCLLPAHIACADLIRDIRSAAAAARAREEQEAEALAGAWVVSDSDSTD